MIRSATIIGASVLLALAGAASAQTSTGQGSASKPQAQQPSAGASATTGQATGGQPTTAPAAGQTQAPAAQQTSRYYQLQSGDMRASTLVNANIYNAEGDSIGEIEEVVIRPNGVVAAVIVSVGGFLGLGERRVAIPFGNLKMAPDEDGQLRFTTSATRDDLSNAPGWVWPGG